MKKILIQLQIAFKIAYHKIFMQLDKFHANNERDYNSIHDVYDNNNNEKFDNNNIIDVMPRAVAISLGCCQREC